MHHCCKNQINKQTLLKNRRKYFAPVFIVQDYYIINGIFYTLFVWFSFFI